MNPVLHRFASYLLPIEFPPLPNFPFDVFRPKVFCRVGRDSVSISMDRSKIIGEPDFSRHEMFSIFEKNRFLLLEKNVFFEAWTLLTTDLQSPFCQKSSEVAKNTETAKVSIKVERLLKVWSVWANNNQTNEKLSAGGQFYKFFTG